jgi:hypothetical protein
MPVPLPRAWVKTALAAGVASSMSAVVTMPQRGSAGPVQVVARYSTRGAKKGLVTLAGQTPSWLFLKWLPVE